MKLQTEKQSSSKPVKKFKVKKIRTMPDETRAGDSKMFYIPTNFMTKQSWLRTTADLRNSRSGNSSRSLLKENRNLNVCLNVPVQPKKDTRPSHVHLQASELLTVKTNKTSVFNHDNFGTQTRNSNKKLNAEESRYTQRLRESKPANSVRKDFSKSSTKENYASRPDTKNTIKNKPATNRS